MPLVLDQPDRDVSALRPPRFLQLHTSAAGQRWLTRSLIVAVGLLAAASTAGQVLKYGYGHTQVYGLVPAFYLDNESSVPTWYSSVELLLAGLLLGAVCVAKLTQRDPFRWHWGALAALFVLMSVDEIAMFHELPIDPLRAALNADGVLHYTWVLPGALFVAITGVAFARFLLHLPVPTRRGFLLAGFVFVGGAIGVEMLSGWEASQWGEENLVYALTITVEECCEMLGVIILINALTGYMASNGVNLRIGVSAESRS